MHDPTEGGIASGLHELALAAGAAVRVDRSQVAWFDPGVEICRALGADPWATLASGSLLAAPIILHQGQAAILGRPVLLVYAAIFWLVVASFVRFYEEPTLSRRYGEQYAAYRRAVRGWWPRLTPWDGDHGSTRTGAASPSNASAAERYAAVAPTSRTWWL